MIVNEIFRSLQGESTFTGIPCVFLRLTGCNLRCSYCDTKYSYCEGTNKFVNEVAHEIFSQIENDDVLEITGGEPIMQFKEINDLIEHLRYNYNVNNTILIETNGSMDISKIDRYGDVRMIMDWKGPSSGMNDKMLESNLKKLKKKDELKFVIGTDADYNEMLRVIQNYKIKAKVLVSTIWESKKREQFVQRILDDKLNVRFQLQIHKVIWDKDKRAV